MNSSPSKRGTNLPRTNIDAWKMIHFPLRCSPFGGHFFLGGWGEFAKNAWNRWWLLVDDCRCITVICDIVMFFTHLDVLLTIHKPWTLVVEEISLKTKHFQRQFQSLKTHSKSIPHIPSSHWHDKLQQKLTKTDGNLKRNSEKGSSLLSNSVNASLSLSDSSMRVFYPIYRWRRAPILGTLWSKGAKLLVFRSCWLTGQSLIWPNKTNSLDSVGLVFH